MMGKGASHLHQHRTRRLSAHGINTYEGNCS